MSSWMVETAKEELRLLESQHPKRFDYLKIELRALISLADADAPSSSSTVSTQVSSNRKRKKDEDVGSKEKEKLMKKKRKEEHEETWKRTSVDMALERAHSCLLRIQQFKLTFFD